MTAEPKRKDRERERHRREIMAAARELFARGGYERTSMACIAERAEFAVGTLYRFFKDKRALYRALILDTVEEFADELVTALQGPGNEIERLERYVEVKARLFVRHIPTARLYFTQTVGAGLLPTAGMDQEIRTVYQRVLDILESVVGDGMSKGLILKMNPRMLVLGLEGLSNAYVEVLIERRDDMEAGVLADTVKAIFFRPVAVEGAR
ncbi:MAG: helix-turn-helix transcriptional regulator [Phycisphaerae bacterium]|nr:helix-turn-helix transcriptional regulator [Phycisphaerae bacterium]